MPKKDEHVRFRNSEKKIRWSFMTYADVKRILVPEDNGKKKTDSFIVANIKNMLLAAMAVN